MNAVRWSARSRATTGRVVATGGSIVSEPATYDLLLSTCFTVWLKAALEEHMARVAAQGDDRPMAGNREAMEDLRRILPAAKNSTPKPMSRSTRRAKLSKRALRNSCAQSVAVESLQEVV